MLQYLGQKASQFAGLAGKAYYASGAGLALGSKVTGAMAGLAGATGIIAGATGVALSPAIATAAAGVVGAHATMSSIQKAGQLMHGVLDSVGAAPRKSYLER